MLEGNLCSGSDQQSISEQLHLVVKFTPSLPYFLTLFLLSRTLEGSTKAPSRVSTFQSRQSPTHPYSSRFYNTCSATEAMKMLDQGSFHPRLVQTLMDSPCVLSDNTTVHAQESEWNLYCLQGNLFCTKVSECLSLIYLFLDANV